jgi:CrcB protein
VARFLLICLGGALGTGVRYLTALAAVRWVGAEFPIGTLAVNLVGAFAIGLVQALGAAAMIPETLRLALAIGVMGGLTTYSAFSYETVVLMEVGGWSRVWLNIVLTNAGTLALCALGIAAGRALAR